MASGLFKTKVGFTKRNGDEIYVELQASEWTEAKITNKRLGGNSAKLTKPRETNDN